MTNTLDAPLAFGQLSIWRTLQLLPVDRWSEANVPRTWPVPADTTPAQVAAAWRALVVRHEALRTWFVPDGSNGLRQRVGEADPDWTPTPVTLASADPAAVAAAVANLAKDPIDLAAEYGWRVGFTDRTVDGARHVLVVVHHIVADAWSFDQLHAEFTAALAGDPPTEPGLRPIALAEEQRAEATAARYRAAVEFVASRLTALPSRPSSSVPSESTQRIQAELVSPAGQQALVAVARDIKASPQTVLLALTAVCLHQVWRGTEVKVTLVTGNRTDRRWRALVTSMNQSVPVSIRHAADDLTFTELARTVQDENLRAYRHGVYDIDAVIAALAPAGVELFNTGSMFNYMAYDLDPAAVNAVARELRPQKPRRHTGPRFDIKIYDRPALKINVRVDRALLTEEGLDAVLEWYEQELITIAANPDEPVREMSRRCVPSSLAVGF